MSTDVKYVAPDGMVYDTIAEMQAGYEASLPRRYVELTRIQGGEGIYWTDDGDLMAVIHDDEAWVAFCCDTSAVTWKPLPGDQ